MMNFNPKEMGDRYLINFLITMDKRARHVQSLPHCAIKDGDHVVVPHNCPLGNNAALYRYQLPEDYWSAYAEAQKRGLI